MRIKLNTVKIFYVFIALIISVVTSTVAFGQAPDVSDSGDIASQEVYSLAQTDTSHYAGLLEKAKAEGKMRIIVGVKASFIPEGRHRTPERVAEQRAGIATAQESLLKTVRIPDENSVKKFKYIPFVAMEVDEAALQFLMNNPMVNSIEEDKLLKPQLYGTIPQIGANTGEADYYTGYTGKGQTIAILDSGVDKTHPFLSGKVVEEACYSSGGSSLCPNGQTSQIGSGAGVNCSTSISAACAHGTHVAGIAAGKKYNNGSYNLRGVAPDANIIAIQVFHEVNNDSVCGWWMSPCLRSSDSDYILALEHVYDLRNSYNIASVNMSLGSGGYTSTSYCDANFSSEKATVDQLRSVGIATVIASGNDGYTNGISSPACISTAISVGATNMYFGTEEVTGYSNNASFLSLLAPGGYCGPGCIVGALGLTGIYSSIPYDSWYGYWGKMSGTSMAAPLVAGAWALMKEKNPSASVDTILSTLQSTGKYFYDSKSGVTTPRIQVNSALAALPLLPKSPVYRFASDHDHFFTISESEKNSIMQNLPNYHYEGVAFYAYPSQASGTSPVYRFASDHDHFFTISGSEKNSIMQNLPNYHYEGVAFYAYPAQASGTSPVYRFASDHDHFFTISGSEKNSIMQNLPNYHYEGVAFYAYPAQ